MQILVISVKEDAIATMVGALFVVKIAKIVLLNFQINAQAALMETVLSGADAYNALKIVKHVSLKVFAQNAKEDFSLMVRPNALNVLKTVSNVKARQNA